MAMAVMDDNSSNSSSSSQNPLSSPSPPPRCESDQYEFLPHPKDTPRTMRRKRRRPPPVRSRNPTRSLRFPTVSESDFLPPEGSKYHEDKKLNTSGTTSDYGTLSVNNLVELDSVLSNSLSNMSLLDEEKRHHDTEVEILRINSEAFVLYPVPISYNLRSSLSVNLTDEQVNLSTDTLSQISEAIEVTKYNLTKPAIFCMNCRHPRVHIFKRLFQTFIHIETVKVQKNLLVFKIDSAGTYAVFKSQKDPVIDYVHLNPRKDTTFRLTKDPDDPLIEVIFDKGCVDQRVRLKGQVFFEELHTEKEYLASPVISLSPHGAMFDKDVQIRIEILKTSEADNFSDKNLRVYVDRRNFENTWSPIHDFKVVKDENGRTFVEFHVRHFSLFKVVRDGMKKIGSGLISTFFGRSSTNSECFQMKCQASMDEFENNHFGLEVCVFRAEKSFPEVMNYTHIVGKSLSKIVKCGGKLTIYLKSNLFRADTEAGEQEEMIKDENDFKGQDFCRDFALVFNENIQQRTGPFGKVVVSRTDEKGIKETIFEFNIQKLGNEAERRDKLPGASNVTDQWATVPLEELALNFGVTDGDNWKSLAKSLGFTKPEIKAFKKSGAPFKAVQDAFRARGGEARSFVNKLYATFRQRTVENNQGTGGSPLSNPPSPGRVSVSASSGLGSSRHSQNILYPRNRSISSSSSSSESGNENPAEGSDVVMHPPVPPPSYQEHRPSKRKRRKSPKHSRKKRKRRHSTTSSSSSSSTQSSDHRTKNSSHNSKISDKSLRSDSRKLSESYLWELTEFLTNPHWKALGRTLQVEESQLTGIATQHQGGNRELYYQMLLTWKEKYPSKFTFGTLYSALMKENMCAVAKKMDSVYRKLQKQNK